MARVPLVRYPCLISKPDTQSQIHSLYGKKSMIVVFRRSCSQTRRRCSFCRAISSNPDTTRDAPCTTILLKFKVLLVTWFGNLEWVTAQVSSSSLDRGSKLRGPLPIAVVYPFKFGIIKLSQSTHMFLFLVHFEF
ncbi:hypothetical protein TNCV_530581 [Trichonephila clavipes]|nr:hypothetical protein TNCV_530581 [Trichonephila clavipes]